MHFDGVLYISARIKKSLVLTHFSREARIFLCHLNKLFQLNSQIHKYLSVTRKSKSSMHNSQVVQH